MLSRRDAAINFNWGQPPPAPGLPAESFSVRWAAWLLPPASGKYTFQVNVDDGIRLWLNGKLLLNEWRGQPLSSYTAVVVLRAGELYRLRVDYCQYGLDTRVFVNWTRPDAPPPSPASWRNLWGITAETPRPRVEPIPTQFLFSRNPRPGSDIAAASTPLSTVARQPVPGRAAATRPAVQATDRTPAAPGRRRPVVAVPTVRTLVPVSPATPLPRPAIADPAPAVVAPPEATRLASLAVGETLTLPAVFFRAGPSQPAARYPRHPR